MPNRTTTTEQNRALMERYIQQAWNEGDWSVAEELIDENAVFHDQVREGKLPPGRAGVRAAMEIIRVGMPDFVMDLQEIIADRDLVVIRWSATGTHAGVFNGLPATNRVVTLHAMSIVRFRDGKIVEGWQEADQLGMGRELGMVPKSDMPRPIASLLSFAIRTRDRLVGAR
ncbi:ester cyclase [Nocardia sp. NPDC059239]|uniref:ester cyclase n=1 Tax=unclassified Nocardia TaxID=2637762 RepID=UPI00368B23B4